jgi:hypothetical protein
MCGNVHVTTPRLALVLSAATRSVPAIDVWRSDLKGERFVVDGEEIVV